MALSPHDIATLEKGEKRTLAIEGIAKELGAVMRKHLDESTKTCINCFHFQETTEQCKLFRARPPARIIAFGCEKYDDQIPF